MSKESLSAKLLRIRDDAEKDLETMNDRFLTPKPEHRATLRRQRRRPGSAGSGSPTRQSSTSSSVSPRQSANASSRTLNRMSARVGVNADSSVTPNISGEDTSVRRSRRLSGTPARAEPSNRPAARPQTDHTQTPQSSSSTPLPPSAAGPQTDHTQTPQSSASTPLPPSAAGFAIQSSSTPAATAKQRRRTPATTPNANNTTPSHSAMSSVDLGSTPLSSGGGGRRSARLIGKRSQQRFRNIRLSGSSIYSSSVMSPSSPVDYTTDDQGCIVLEPSSDENSSASDAKTSRSENEHATTEAKLLMRWLVSLSRWMTPNAGWHNRTVLPRSTAVQMQNRLSCWFSRMSAPLSEQSDPLRFQRVYFPLNTCEIPGLGTIDHSAVASRLQRMLRGGAVSDWIEDPRCYFRRWSNEAVHNVWTPCAEKCLQRFQYSLGLLLCRGGIQVVVRAVITGCDRCGDGFSCWCVDTIWYAVPFERVRKLWVCSNQTRPFIAVSFCPQTTSERNPCVAEMLAQASLSSTTDRDRVPVKRRPSGGSSERKTDSCAVAVDRSGFSMDIWRRFARTGVNLVKRSQCPDQCVCMCCGGSERYRLPKPDDSTAKSRDNSKKHQRFSFRSLFRKASSNSSEQRDEKQASYGFVVPERNEFPLRRIKQGLLRAFNVLNPKKHAVLRGLLVQLWTLYVQLELLCRPSNEADACFGYKLGEETRLGLPELPFYPPALRGKVAFFRIDTAINHAGMRWVGGSRLLGRSTKHTAQSTNGTGQYAGWGEVPDKVCPTLNPAFVHATMSHIVPALNHLGGGTVISKTSSISSVHSLALCFPAEFRRWFFGFCRDSLHLINLRTQTCELNRLVLDARGDSVADCGYKKPFHDLVGGLMSTPCRFYACTPSHLSPSHQLVCPSRVASMFFSRFVRRLCRSYSGEKAKAVFVCRFKESCTEDAVIRVEGLLEDVVTEPEHLQTAVTTADGNAGVHGDIATVSKNNGTRQQSGAGKGIDTDTGSNQTDTTTDDVVRKRSPQTSDGKEHVKGVTDITGGKPHECVQPAEVQSCMTPNFRSGGSRHSEARYWLNRTALLPRGGNRYAVYSTGNDAVTVTARDLECLRPGEWLNDNVISFFMKYLQNVILSPEDRKSMHFMSSHLFTKLTQARRSHPSVPVPLQVPTDIKGVHKAITHRVADVSAQLWQNYLNVRNWTTAKVDLFKKSFIFVPINADSHWVLCVICYPNERVWSRQKVKWATRWWQQNIKPSLSRDKNSSSGPFVHTTSDAPFDESVFADPQLKRKGRQPAQRRGDHHKQTVSTSRDKQPAVDDVECISGTPPTRRTHTLKLSLRQITSRKSPRQLRRDKLLGTSQADTRSQASPARQYDIFAAVRTPSPAQKNRKNSHKTSTPLMDADGPAQRRKVSTSSRTSVRVDSPMSPVTVGQKRIRSGSNPTLEPRKRRALLLAGGTQTNDKSGLKSVAESVSSDTGEATDSSELSDAKSAGDVVVSAESAPHTCTQRKKGALRAARSDFERFVAGRARSKRRSGGTRRDRSRPTTGVVFVEESSDTSSSEQVLDVSSPPAPPPRPPEDTQSEGISQCQDGAHGIDGKDCGASDGDNDNTVRFTYCPHRCFRRSMNHSQFGACPHMLRMPCVLYMDSLAEARSQHVRYGRILSQYMRCEWVTRKRYAQHPALPNLLNFPAICVPVPQQPNAVDCGVYIMHFMEKFALNPFAFLMNDRQVLDHSGWFSEGAIRSKRQHVYRVLKDLHLAQTIEGKLFRADVASHWDRAQVQYTSHLSTQ